MPTITHVVEDQTETLVSYPPVIGQASAANVRIGTPAVSMPDEGSEDAATIDTVDTTISAAANAGDKSITVASASGITEGYQYYLDTDFGPLVVEVEEIESTTIHMTNPLPTAVESGTAFKGYAISHALTAAETADVGQSLAQWDATIGGVLYRWDQHFLVVNDNINYTLNGTRLVDLQPIVRELRPAHDETFEDSIAAAWGTYLVPDFAEKGIRIERINSWEPLEALHSTAVVAHLLSQATNANPDFRDFWEAKYRKQSLDLLSNPLWWYDADDNEAGVPDGDPANRPFTTSWIHR